MQKLDLFSVLERISRGLHSSELAALTTADMQQMRSGNQGWSNDKILPLLIDSKSHYDVLEADPVIRRILEVLRAPSVYSTSNFAALMRNVSTGSTLHGVYHAQLFNVYELHLAIQTLLTAFSELLIPNRALLGESNDTTDITVFEIIDPTDSLDLGHLSRIITLLDDLCRMIQSILSPGTEPVAPRVVLLDLGSSGAIGLKTTVEAAATLAQVFKEMWDWVVNREHYKNCVTVETLNVNLSVLERIKAARESGALSEERAKEYAELIERRTDDLIRLGVLPKPLAAHVTSYNNTALLLSLGNTKQLDQGGQPGEESGPPEPLEDGPVPGGGSDE